MLILGCDPGEYVVINENVKVKVIRNKGGIKLAIDAPKSVRIERGDVYERRCQALDDSNINLD